MNRRFEENMSLGYSKTHYSVRLDRLDTDCACRLAPRDILEEETHIWATIYTHYDIINKQLA